MALNDTTQIRYNDPAGGTNSDIDAGSGGRQINTEYWHKKALVEEAKETYFGQLSDTKNMPKHMGKKLSMYHYLPILSDENVNDQGIDASGATITDGNLYGSSKDVTTISGKIPLLGETGGRANRIGASRKVIEAEMTKIGFFTEFSKDALDFDTDNELYGHLSGEVIKAANELQEDLIQMDLLNGAGVVKFAGVATQTSEITGEGSEVSEVTYDDLQRLAKDMFDNRTPKQTKVIVGSRLVDTRVVNSAMYMYVGSDMVATLSRMTDHHGNPAFVGVEHYAHSGVAGVNSINGEIGKVGEFRIVQVPEMQKWEGAGAAETGANAGYQATGAKYDVFPMLVVGAGSFSTIGFQTDGKSTKFKIKHSFPGDDVSYGAHDPFGEIGFMSIKFWYGTLIMRPERLGLVKTVARA
ncbi:major capsid protein [Vibrio phage 1.238.A._10N.261.52.F10]|uniref:Major capsid protein n=1 Tax=Vibrio phage 1.238.A._10N.261.52.F10 TaxID=1881231 RepID=A0A2I7RUE1_9CAUD|nr:major head protein [Vibrio phage 1.238.A._10N.261.52.F10]AUR97282.1 major capsid protein [Vibrio phage 1.238.A._10N.261.52.F10]AUR97376.1 major capsid protein [Vibrio phage 1.238.B._10N.261.52.F10]